MPTGPSHARCRGATARRPAVAALGLLVGTGCANFAPAEAVGYSSFWQGFAAQATSGLPAGPTGPTAPAADLADVAGAFATVPEAGRIVARAQRVLQGPAPARSEVRDALRALDEAERLVQKHAGDDRALLADLRARLDDLRRRVEAKLVEIAAIEPSFNVARRGRVRVAVVKIGDGVETIRRAEMLDWRVFLADAGFDPDVAFVTSPLGGPTPTAADLRVAAARLGADAVLAYTTSAAVTTDWSQTSAAVLAFAKCMVVDTRSEFLYLNAEGECRRRRVGLPFTISAPGLELECRAASVVDLRAAVRHEIARLVRTQAGGGD